jgi:hypothetical protein
MGGAVVGEGPNVADVRRRKRRVEDKVVSTLHIEPWKKLFLAY